MLVIRIVRMNGSKVVLMDMIVLIRIVVELDFLGKDLINVGYVFELSNEFVILVVMVNINVMG